MREMVEYILKQIVDNPEEVKVEEIKGERVILLEVSVAKEDRGKVIGKGGRIATALRTLLGAAAAKLKKRAMLETLEERTSTMEQQKGG